MARKKKQQLQFENMHKILDTSDALLFLCILKVNSKVWYPSEAEKDMIWL